LSDFLLTVAEIAIALAGFSGVVIAFGHGIAGQPNFRLSLLLTLSGEVVLFSLFPILLSLRLSEQLVWLVAAPLYGTVHVGQLVYSVVGYQDAKAGMATPRLDKVLMTIGTGLSVALVATGFLGSVSDIQILYASLLLFALCVAGTQFYRLLMVIWRKGES